MLCPTTSSTSYSGVSKTSIAPILHPHKNSTSILQAWISPQRPLFKTHRKCVCDHDRWLFPMTQVNGSLQCA